ncbi:MAG: glutathione synthase [Pelagibacteraceae bacterium]|jgi:glutathione synthase|nr:glutathione synthase [Pelagibacteraceae bacterium]OUV88459.1 MAG: glutathione synthase [Pelagibacteraceae bacterium TMED146]RZO93108.1 MAG: glutathione synthase [alpha proteobacterium HIMB114]|tara:strand:- start:5497 stop:6447 length:951 start_codon:yes stop_codon:yes gene_type:complete
MKKHFKIAIQMDPLEKINPKEDSTFVIAQEAQRRGYKLFHYSPKDISLKNNTIIAKGCYFKIINQGKKFFKKQKKISINLNQFHYVLVRQDPPFNMEYITATYFLEMLNQKVLVVNNPAEIRNNPEKLSMFNFKNLIPDTLISEDLTEIQNFIKKYKFTILKPLYGNGGEGIEKVTKGSLKNKTIIQRMIKKYKGAIIAQKFIKEISQGDRRIILIDGEYMGSVARIPKKGSIKANFHAGGSAQKSGLVFKDRKICSKLKPYLKKKGLFFTGIDAIGNYLTEINVTSPTGMQEINQLNNTRLEKIFWDKLEKKIKK